MVNKKYNQPVVIDRAIASPREPDSVHWVGSILTDDYTKLVDMDDAMDAITNIVKTNQAQILDVLAYSFTTPSEQSGYTLVFCLAESHIALHSWPEHAAVELDVYLCNYLRDNRNKCTRIFDQIVEYYDANKVLSEKVARPSMKKFAR